MANPIKAGLAALALTTLPFAGAAHAEDAPQVAAVAATSSAVPVKSASGVSEETIIMGASVASRDGQAIVYYGEDQNIVDAISRGANSAKSDANLPVKYIILADPKEEVWSGKYLIVPSHQIEIYTNGQKTTTVDNPDIEIQFELNGILSNDLQRLTQASYSVPEQGL